LSRLGISNTSVLRRKLPTALHWLNRNKQMQFMSSFLLMPIAAFKVKIVYFQVAVKDYCSEAIRAVLCFEKRVQKCRKVLGY